MSHATEVTAVLLIAHGSRHGPANDDLHELAARLVARGDYTIVEPAFLELAQPDIPSGADRCVARGARRVLMIPYFLSTGVHLRRDLTAACDLLSARYPEVAFVLGPALGPDPWLDRLVTERIRQTAASDRGTAEAVTEDTSERCASEEASAGSAPAACAGGLSAIDTNRPKD